MRDGAAGFRGSLPRASTTTGIARLNCGRSPLHYARSGGSGPVGVTESRCLAVCGGAKPRRVVHGGTWAVAHAIRSSERSGDDISGTTSRRLRVRMELKAHRFPPAVVTPVGSGRRVCCAPRGSMVITNHAHPRDGARGIHMLTAPLPAAGAVRAPVHLPGAARPADKRRPAIAAPFHRRSARSSQQTRRRRYPQLDCSRRLQGAAKRWPVVCLRGR